VLLSHARLALSMLDKAREEVRLIRGGSGARVAGDVAPGFDQGAARSLENV
jgi:hypothetical protein